MNEMFIIKCWSILVISGVLYNTDLILSDELTEETNPNNEDEASPESQSRIIALVPGLDQSSGHCSSVPRSCVDSKYRSMNGSCNNLRRPGWGSAESVYGRRAKSNYGDGVRTLPKASSGGALPNVRSLRLEFFPVNEVLNTDFTLLLQQFGQVVTHDMSLTRGITQINNNTIKCCIDGKLTPTSNQTLCAPIVIPEGDPILKPGTCMDFVRTLSTRDIGCAPQSKPAEQITTTTAFLDASLVYGNSDKDVKQLRLFSDGLLKSIEKYNQEFPNQSPNVTRDCVGARSPNEACYKTGDVRSNQSPHLATLQVNLFREHNRLARGLKKINSRWNDEKLFQEARRILIATLQHITYNEYLPLIVGKDNMIERKLIHPDNDGYVNNYNPDLNPSVLNEHANGAFRFLHTLIVGQLELSNEQREKFGDVRLSDFFNRPQILEDNEGANFDNLLRGCTHQRPSESDSIFDKEVIDFLFRGQNKYGLDLKTIDIQRGRDHGLASYVTTREALGLSKIQSFDDMRAHIPDATVDKLESVYENVEDVDLVVGASLEERVPGTLLGETFLNIILEQFRRTCKGDRYFYRNGENKLIAFTLKQLRSILEGASMARLLCDNSNVSQMQPEAFKQITESNKLVPCSELPKIDLSLWRERPGILPNIL